MAGTLKLDPKIGIILCRNYCRSSAKQCRTCRLWQFVQANIYVERHGMSIKEAIEKTEKEADQTLKNINGKHDQEHQFVLEGG